MYSDSKSMAIAMTEGKSAAECNMCISEIQTFMQTCFVKIEQIDKFRNNFPFIKKLPKNLRPGSSTLNNMISDGIQAIELIQQIKLDKMEQEADASFSKTITNSFK